MKPIDFAERPTRPALFALLFIAVMAGAMNGFAATRHAAQPLLWTHALDLTFSFLCFVWYCRDGDARSYIRSRWLNVAMITVTMFTVPYYLWRSRPQGQRLRAIMRYAGFGVLLGGVAALGFVLGVLLG
jgi:ribose/xylose/arabinose/galactoside ABC-type transport system permease subunit